MIYTCPICANRPVYKLVTCLRCLRTMCDVCRYKPYENKSIYCTYCERRIRERSDPELAKVMLPPMRDDLCTCPDNPVEDQVWKHCPVHPKL